MKPKIVIGSAAILACCIPVLALWPQPTSLDLWVYQQQLALHEPFRYALTYITEFGKSEYFLVPSLLFAVGAWLYARHQKLLCQRGRWLRRALISAYIFVAVALSGLIVNLIKLLVGRSRPKEWLEDGAYGLDPFSLDSRWHSFPSGHANTMVAVTIAFLLFAPKAWRAPVVLLSSIIIASRCIVGAHYMSDILGGALVAMLTCWWLERMARQRLGHKLFHDKLS